MHDMETLQIHGRFRAIKTSHTTTSKSYHSCLGEVSKNNKSDYDLPLDAPRITILLKQNYPNSIL
jgi:hypothetical protein